MKRTINAFILGIIGLIFTFDTFAYLRQNDTISEQITGWIDKSTSHLVIFICLMVIVALHFIFGKYQD